MIKYTYQQAKDFFFHSQGCWRAWLLLLGILACTAGLIGLTTILYTSSNVLFEALVAYNSAVFTTVFQELAIVSLIYGVISGVYSMLFDTLRAQWRKHLTDKYCNEFINKEYKQYLNNSRTKKLPNPGQYIQYSIDVFTEQSLKIALDFLFNVCSAVTALASLWIIGGSFSFVLYGVSLTIPGYLAWASLLIGAVTNGITYLVSNGLARLNGEKQVLEAEYRNDIDMLDHYAESVGLDQGEGYYQRTLGRKFAAINAKSLEVRDNLGLVKGVSYFFSQLTWLFPYLIVAPIYFAKRIGYSQVMEASVAFSRLQSPMIWFSTVLESLSNYRASATWLAELDQTMYKHRIAIRNQKRKKSGIQHQHFNCKEIKLQGVGLSLPTDGRIVFRNFTYDFKKGQNVIISGRSGFGKSTLFKAIAGTWSHGQGEILVLKDARVYFMPQKPVIPTDTLQNVLSYPDNDGLSSTKYESALERVGLGALATRLSEKNAWSQELSGGEQQRIAFARLLLKKPDWVFLDEATASLDNEYERKMYQLLKDDLPETTFISIAHRETVIEYHTRHIEILGKRSKDDSLIWKEKTITPRSESDRSSPSFFPPAAAPKFSAVLIKSPAAPR